MKGFGIADPKESNDVFEIGGAGGERAEWRRVLGPWQVQLARMIPATSSNA
jgi:hypothetical protein